ncbi:MAG: membrane protein insertase YidC [Desulfobacteraceae bacterium]
MEQSRLFIAIGISFLIVFLWSVFFTPKTPKTPDQAVKDGTAQIAPADNAEQPKTAPPAAPPATATTPPPVTAPATMPAQPTKKTAKTVTVDTALYRATLSEKGGAVLHFVLKDYREALDKKSPLKEVIHSETPGGTLLVSLPGVPGADLEKAVYTIDTDLSQVTVGTNPQPIRFTFQTPSGIRVEKIYTFHPDSYLIDLKVNVFNGGAQTYKGSLALGLRNTPDKAGARIGFQGTSGYIGGDLKQIKAKNFDEKGRVSGAIGWVAIVDRYFMTSIIPTGDLEGHMVLSEEKITKQNQGDIDVLKNQVVKDIPALAPQQTATLETTVFMGPKSLKLLRSFHNNLDKAVNFGFFDFLAKPCLWFMNFIYGFIPNYGIAIIILTILTRGMFWPLAKKSYKSMGEMRKIQPLMQEIREKYKDDKQRMNQEMMTLYRTYKINPLGGCLPMLIQLPVFFALYRMLYSAIELRHAPFFGWITDLSAPDRLFHFGFEVPYMENPDGIPVMTLLMGASMLLQQKMTPTPGDPAQAKMMMLMPIIFTFIFINFSSGLVLYWFVSNIFSIAQQYYTQKQTA